MTDIVPLTKDELSDFREDIGDVNEAFSDAALQRIYVRCTGRAAKSRVMAIDQLLGSAAKLADYAQNESEEKKSQIFKQLLDLRKIWVGYAESEGVSAASGSGGSLRIVPVKPIRKVKDSPCA